MAPARFVAQAGCALVIIAALSLAARGSLPPPVRSHAPDQAGASAFIPSAAEAVPAIPKNAAAAGRDDPGSAAPDGGKLHHTDPATGWREEALTQGEFPVIEAPYLHLTVTDGPVNQSPALFVTMARRAADGRGLFVARTGERGRIETKFGPVETLEATLTSLSDAETSRVCTGFATRPPAAVRIDGWLCAPLGLAPEPRAIACALDRLPGNGQALPHQDEDRAEVRAIEPVPQAKARPSPDCGPWPEIAGQTGSIERPKKRREARMRRSTQAWP